MKDVVKEMLNHPIATMFIVWAFGSAVSDIVTAARKKTPEVDSVDLENIATQLEVIYQHVCTVEEKVLLKEDVTCSPPA